MPCVNSALWYVELERMRSLEKILIEGTDLGVGMEIRGSIYFTVCDHMHSGGVIQLPLKSVTICCWISLIQTSLASVLHRVSPFGFQRRHPYGKNRDISLLFHCKCVFLLQQTRALQLANVPCLRLRTGEVVVLRRKLQISEPAQRYGNFPPFRAAAANTSTGLPQDLSPTWAMHLLVATTSQMFLPVQSDAAFRQFRVFSALLVHLTPLIPCHLDRNQSGLPLFAYLVFCVSTREGRYTKKWWLKIAEEIIYLSVSPSSQLEPNASFRTHVSQTGWILIDQTISLSEVWCARRFFFKKKSGDVYLISRHYFRVEQKKPKQTQTLK